ncbi:MAG: apolipoprotein N-acyltransferase [Candidatus Latescibacteria bacterium]|nr:apolipoprotein N-acyltransferase [Candidatus Latescibacterota bacterium]
MPRLVPGLAPAAGLLAGGLFALSIPPFDWYPLAWICLVPGLVCLGQADRPWLLGLGGGLLAGLSRIYWQYETLQLYGNLPPVASLLTTAALVAYLSLYWVAFFWLSARWRADSPWFAWNAACLWVLLEWVQTWMISGFPWELLGYSQYLNLGLAQTASVAGVYGLSFLLVLLNAGLAQVALHRAAGLRLAAAPLLLVALAWGWGDWRLRQLEAETPAPPLRVGLVQGSIDQGEKWKGDRLGQTTQRYVDLASTLAAERPLDLVVFPETCLPFYFLDPRFASYRAPFTALAGQLGAPMLVGSLDFDGERIYNRAFLLDAQGQVSGHADKVHLVPFGEYLPMPWLFQYLEGLTAESGIFAPGHQRQVLPAGAARLGVFICYESIFPEIARELVQLGANILVNTTNDAWFGRSAAPYQHFSMCVLRAIETGRPVVRIANTGISGLIAPSGRILTATPLFEPLAQVLTLSPRTEQTPYTHWGDLLWWVCGLFLVLPPVYHRVRLRVRK